MGKSFQHETLKNMFESEREWERNNPMGIKPIILTVSKTPVSSNGRDLVSSDHKYPEEHKALTMERTRRMYEREEIERENGRERYTDFRSYD